MVTFSNPSTKKRGGAGNCNLDSARRTGTFYTPPPICSIHVLAKSVGRDAADVSMWFFYLPHSWSAMFAWVKLRTSQARTHLSHMLFWESGPCMVHYDPGYTGQTAPHNTKSQQTHQRKVGINATKTNFTHRIPGEIAHIPGLDTPISYILFSQAHTCAHLSYILFWESGPCMLHHDPGCNGCETCQRPQRPLLPATTMWQSPVPSPSCSKPAPSPRQRSPARTCLFTKAVWV